MAISDLFSKRQKQLRGEVPDVYVYDKLQPSFRGQVVHIIQEAIGVKNSISDHGRSADNVYADIHRILCREYGVFSLRSEHESDRENVLNYFLQVQEVEKAIDVIELAFKVIDTVIRQDYNYSGWNRVQISPEDAIGDLNTRFKENGIGYQYVGGEIIRVDSLYIHSEVVKPVINLLWNRKFMGANEEYLKAHEHYRHGRNKECLTECLKAFESVMKIICKEKGWVYAQNDTSKKLIQICFQNNLVPSFTQNQFSSLQNLLESGVPTIRNRLGGHGQGQIPQKVDDEMARYALNLAGANIVFLVEQSGIK